MSIEIDATAARNPRKRRPWWRAPLLRVAAAVGPRILSAMLQVLAWTFRLTVLNREQLFDRWERGERVIVAFWHNRMVMMPVAAAGHPFCILSSQHRDGEISARTWARWGVQSVRGSTTRGGVGGLLQFMRAYRRGFDLAVAPDGPRGPRYQAKLGTIHLAKATGARIIPVSYAASRVARLRSWDRLVIPLPFARVVMIIGEPLSVPHDANDVEIERQRAALERQLNELTRAAESALA